MKAKYILALAGVMMMAAVLAIPAGAGRATHASATQKVFRSFKCRAHINKYDPTTWACTTITVDPYQVDAGLSTTVTYVFRAKKKLMYVGVCFSGITQKKINCAYKHRFRTMKRGRVIRRVVQLPVPATALSGDLLFDNYSRFYKSQKWVSRRDAYWKANSYLCAISSSQPDFQCSGGK